jgi:hypothetical protein
MDEAGDISKDRLYKQWIKPTEKSIIHCLCQMSTKVAETKINPGLQHIYAGTLNIVLNTKQIWRLIDSLKITQVAYEQYLVGCDIVLSDRSSQTLRRKLLPPVRFRVEDHAMEATSTKQIFYRNDSHRCESLKLNKSLQELPVKKCMQLAEFSVRVKVVTMQFGKNPTFRRNTIPPSSGSKTMLRKKPGKAGGLSWWWLYVPRLSFKISAFCPQSVCVCSVWFSH